eukprot:CAMPEP_0117430340 /NCGR_PEP_ID=MMETSP0758-20121206/9867_1 /TAXON_ID=63605 /ORGANISM="Percolomonas cosmopolitus, Strain AE-1 (ATCC 50343)" /LENGTH=757 /DNA_ID=CAMNT_0005218237 /DNA_START=1497 /DNA_END=3770 /DNA_ORIENTATION=+
MKSHIRIVKENCPLFDISIEKLESKEVTIESFQRFIAEFNFMHFGEKKESKILRTSIQQAEISIASIQNYDITLKDIINTAMYTQDSIDTLFICKQLFIFRSGKEIVSYNELIKKPYIDRDYPIYVNYNTTFSEEQSLFVDMLGINMTQFENGLEMDWISDLSKLFVMNSESHIQVNIHMTNVLYHFVDNIQTKNMLVVYVDEGDYILNNFNATYTLNGVSLLVFHDKYHRLTDVFEGKQTLIPKNENSNLLNASDLGIVSVLTSTHGMVHIGSIPQLKIDVIQNLSTPKIYIDECYAQYYGCVDSFLTFSSIIYNFFKKSHIHYMKRKSSGNFNHVSNSTFMMESQLIFDNFLEDEEDLNTNNDSIQLFATTVEDHEPETKRMHTICNTIEVLEIPNGFLHELQFGNMNFFSTQSLTESSMTQNTDMNQFTLFNHNATLHVYFGSDWDKNRLNTMEIEVEITNLNIDFAKTKKNEKTLQCKIQSIIGTFKDNANTMLMFKRNEKFLESDYDVDIEVVKGQFNGSTAKKWSLNKFKCVPILLNISQAQFPIFYEFYEALQNLPIEKSKKHKMTNIRGDEIEINTEYRHAHIEKLTIDPINVTINYTPTTSYNIFSIQRYKFLSVIETTPLYDLNIDLPRFRHSPSAEENFGHVLLHIVAHYMDHFSTPENNSKIMASIGPIFRLRAISTAMADVIMRPIDHYNQNKSVLSALRNSLLGLSKTISENTIDPSLQAVGAQSFGEGARRGYAAIRGIKKK